MTKKGITRQKLVRRIKKELGLPSSHRMSLSEGQIARFPQMKDRLEDTNRELLEWLYTRKLSEEVISQVNKDINNPFFKISADKIKWFARHPKTPMQIRVAILEDKIKLNQAEYLYENCKADLTRALDAFAKGLDISSVKVWYNKNLPRTSEQAIIALQKREKRDKDQELRNDIDSYIYASDYQILAEHKASKASINLLGRAFIEGRTNFVQYTSRPHRLTYYRNVLLPLFAKGRFTVDLYERIFDDYLDDNKKREALIYALDKGVPADVLLPYCDQHESLRSIKSLTSRSGKVVPPKRTCKNHIIKDLEHADLYYMKTITQDRLDLWKRAKTTCYRGFTIKNEHNNEYNGVYPKILNDRLLYLFSDDDELTTDDVIFYLDHYEKTGEHYDFEAERAFKRRLLGK